jgi:hypothetical protein
LYVRPPRRPRARAEARPGLGPLDDQLALELGQRREDAEHQPAVRGGGVDARSLADEDAQPHAAPGQPVHEVDQVTEVAPEPVELPGDQGVAGAKALQARLQPGPAVALA